MKQIFIPMWDSDRAMEAMVLLSRFLTRTSVFRLFCNQDAAAAKETRSILFDHKEKIRKESEDMRLNEGFVLKSMAGEYVIMPVGSNIAAFDGMVILNEVSAFIIKQLEKGDISREDLLELVLDEYEVDRETAKADLDELSDKLLGIGVITIN